MDELWEALSWAQIGYHAKPVGLLNLDGYYDGLIEFWDKMAEVGFVRPQHVGLLIVADTLEELLDKMAAFAPATTIGQIGAKDLCAAPYSREGGAGITGDDASDSGPRLRTALVASTSPRARDRRDRAGVDRAGVEKLLRRLAACSTAAPASAPGCSMPGAGAATISPTGRIMAMR